MCRSLPADNNTPYPNTDASVDVLEYDGTPEETRRFSSCGYAPSGLRYMQQILDIVVYGKAKMGHITYWILRRGFFFPS